MAPGGDAPARILQAGRLKTFRPLPVGERAAAVSAALEAWERGDWFETHELLEPAWMGTDDLAERLLTQGLIKLAAAFVHRERGNRAGVLTNLVGARDRLREAAGFGSEAAPAIVLETERLINAANDPGTAIETLEPPELRRLLGRRS